MTQGKTNPMTLAELHQRLMTNIWDDDTMDLYNETLGSIPTRAASKSLNLHNAEHMAQVLGGQITGGQIDDRDPPMHVWEFPDLSMSCISESAIEDLLEV